MLKFLETSVEKKNIGTIVLDFDGTVTSVDICDLLVEQFTNDWRSFGKLHDDGDISHAELNRRFVSSLKVSPKELKAFLRGKKLLRKGFKDFVTKIQSQNIPLFIISSGWDFYIKLILEEEALLKNLNFIDCPNNFLTDKINIICNAIYFKDLKWSIKNPITKDFFSCPSKKYIIDTINSLFIGNVVFFGDGSSDYSVVKEVDIVFARGKLALYCEQNSIDFENFENFDSIIFDKIEKTFNERKNSLYSLTKNFFLDPFGSNLNVLFNTFQSTLEAAISVHGEGPLYPYFKEIPSNFDIVNNAFIPESTSLQVYKDISKHIVNGLQGGVKAGHPFMVKNIIPSPSFVFLSCYFAASLYQQNGVTGEDSGEALNSELKVAAVLSEMAGYNKNVSAGLFTFGGTATNMYAFKVGLTKCDPLHFLNGISKNVFVVGSKPAHYSHITVSDWLGLGQNQYIHAKSNIDQTTDLKDLEKCCRDIISSGGKIACIVGVGGSTSNMAIDDFLEIKRIRDNLVSDYQLEYIPHIHSDSVVGWPYLFFKDYDFEKNHLLIDRKALERILRAKNRISTIEFADSFGVDFHKTGYMPYNSSIFICKEGSWIKKLGRDPKLMTPLFHEDEVYNPGKITLETSRSSATMLATWVTIQLLGKDGYRKLLANAQYTSEVIRAEVNNYKESGLLVVNNEGYGTDVFIRCYPIGIKVDKEFEKELSDDSLLEKNSRYNSDFFKWITNTSNPYSKTISISKTSAAFYTHSGEPLVALRLYILSPYMTKEFSKKLVQILANAKVEYDKQLTLSKLEKV